MARLGRGDGLTRAGHSGMGGPTASSPYRGPISTAVAGRPLPCRQVAQSAAAIPAHALSHCIRVLAESWA